MKNKSQILDDFFLYVKTKPIGCRGKCELLYLFSFDIINIDFCTAQNHLQKHHVAHLVSLQKESCHNIHRMIKLRCFLSMYVMYESFDTHSMDLILFGAKFETVIWRMKTDTWSFVMEFNLATLWRAINLIMHEQDYVCMNLDQFI